MGKWAKWVSLGLLVGIPGLLAFAFVGVEISSQPQFCGTCHVMAPYYQSWLTSTHNHVACVECHIPPGVASEVRKKYEALAMVARYFTGTYSTNPWAEVDDESCLRSGCHTKRVLLGRELYRGVVMFDHQPHLSEMRREKQLRCTSCHSQIVQGTHLSVTPGTCFLCHFKNTAPNTGTARCTLCHTVPDKMITTAGLSFDHGDVKRYGMECMSCHQAVIRGAGEVPRERCFTCHNEVDRIERYGETEFLHRMHVTEHKVECTNCHIEILHSTPEREEALATPCQSCHSPTAGHAPVRDLYRGVGGQGVTPRPAAMYLAGIHCEACHNAVPGASGRASEVSCMSCHGPKYMAIYRSWQLGVQKRLEGVKAEFAEAKKRIAAKDGQATAAVAARVEANINLVEQGHGIHNPAYARDILEAAHRGNREMLEAAGEKAGPERPWVEAPYEAECLKCHFGIEYVERPAFDRPFSHGRHVVTARLRCAACHEGTDKHGEMKIGPDDCQRCHDRITRAMTGVAAEECLKCHAAEIGKVSEKIVFPHEKHIENGVDCDSCHSGVFEKPHREFARSSAALPKMGHEFCGNCHAGDVATADGGAPDGANCAKCHPDF